MRQQPTMADIARQAGVSRIAVSYALNDRPGVSSGLRARILDIAQEMGYRANGPALALHGAAAKAVGLVMSRSSAAFTVEVFSRQLIAGVQSDLSAHDFGLALQFVRGTDDEIAVHRRWAAERRVDGVLIVDLRRDDPRPAALAALALPSVVVGGVAASGESAGGNDAWVAEIVGHLAGHGHRRIARVSGPAEMVHTELRDAAFRARGAELGVEVQIVRGDYTGTAGAVLTRNLLGTRDRPTAIVYDNDLMAIGGLGAAREGGLSVPGDVSLVACEDSPLCQVVGPAMSAVQRNITGFGARAARLLLDAVDSGGVPATTTVQTEAGHLVVRRSSGPVPHPPS